MRYFIFSAFYNEHVLSTNVFQTCTLFNLIQEDYPTMKDLRTLAKNDILKQGRVATDITIISINELSKDDFVRLWDEI